MHHVFAFVIFYCDYMTAARILRYCKTRQGPKLPIYFGPMYIRQVKTTHEVTHFARKCVGVLETHETLILLNSLALKNDQSGTPKPVVHSQFINQYWGDISSFNMFI